MPGSWQMAHKHLLNKQRHDSHPLACRRGSRPPGPRGTGLCPQGKLCGVWKPLGTKGPLLDRVCMSLWSPGCGNSCNPSLDPQGGTETPTRAFYLPFRWFCSARGRTYLLMPVCQSLSYVTFRRRFAYLTHRLKEATFSPPVPPTATR